MNNRCNVLKMGVDVVTLESAAKKIEGMAKQQKGAYVCVSNVHMCMEVADSATFSDIVNQADLVIPDGKPIAWAQQLLGKTDAQQVRGQDIMNSLCAHSGENSLNIGLYGGSSSDVLDKVIVQLKKQFPNIKISYFYSPPFRSLTTDENQKIIDEINQCAVNVLFVGIGCPKQEKWMAAHKNQLNCVMLGVGAAFDFISGEKKHAPVLLQKVGLEWLFRLLSEPKRLWRRYYSTIPRFLWHFSVQLVKHKYNS